MVGSEPSFRACLAGALGIPIDDLPLPEFDPNVFWRHWLAARNLGLVPIADPAVFEWPGFWIAASTGADDERDAVLMFGAPSGPLLDPAGVFRDNGSLVEAVAIAPLDLGLAPAAPYGEAPAAKGIVVGLLVAPVATGALVRVEEARAVAGRGLEGDRYENGAGTFSGTGRGYQLTLVEAEALEGVRADGIEITWEEARRNVVTRGIRLNALVDRRFRIGEAECIGRRLAEPCSHLQSLSPAGALRALVRRGGLRADIVSSGTVCEGDAVVAFDDHDRVVNR
jgi:MOSC domain-containing protein YiiM